MPDGERRVGHRSHQALVLQLRSQGLDPHPRHDGDHELLGVQLVHEVKGEAVEVLGLDRKQDDPSAAGGQRDFVGSVKTVALGELITADRHGFADVHLARVSETRGDQSTDDTFAHIAAAEQADTTNSRLNSGHV